MGGMKPRREKWLRKWSWEVENRTLHLHVMRRGSSKGLMGEAVGGWQVE